MSGVTWSPRPGAWGQPHRPGAAKGHREALDHRLHFGRTLKRIEGLQLTDSHEIQRGQQLDDGINALVVNGTSRISDTIRAVTRPFDRARTRVEPACTNPLLYSTWRDARSSSALFIGGHYNHPLHARY